MIKAVRGAISVDANDHLSMIEAVARLIETVREKNGIDENKIVSIIFSQTDDLNVANPAAALRKGGAYASVPLFCTKEPEYEGSIGSLVRVLITYDGKDGVSPVPVYLGEAEGLRTDLKSPDEY